MKNDRLSNHNYDNDHVASMVMFKIELIANDVIGAEAVNIELE